MNIENIFDCIPNVLGVRVGKICDRCYGRGENEEEMMESAHIFQTRENRRK